MTVSRHMKSPVHLVVFLQLIYHQQQPLDDLFDCLNLQILLPTTRYNLGEKISHYSHFIPFPVSRIALLHIRDKGG